MRRFDCPACGGIMYPDWKIEETDSTFKCCSCELRKTLLQAKMEKLKECNIAPSS